MKRWIAVAIGTLLIPAVLYAGSNAVMVVWGDVGPTMTATLTNTSRTLDNIVVTAGGTVKKNGLYPSGAYVTAETYAARFAMSTTPTVDNVGHLLAAAASVHIQGGSAVGSLKFVNAATDEVSVIHLTLEY